MSVPARIEEALQWFGQARRTSRLAHAYLVIGSPRGDARAFVEKVLPLLLCNTGAAVACGVCGACRSIAGNHHQDVIQIEPQGKSCTIPVETMRDLQKQFGQTALSGGRKIAVIWSAERLGEEAANAFLKTLEEPPADSIFFLVTAAPASILPTIRSRCQRLALSESETGRLPEPWQTALSEVLDTLTDGSNTGAWNGYAAACRFLALCGAIRKELQQAADDEAGESDTKETVAARVAARFKEQRALLLQALQLWYRDILLTVCGADAALLWHSDRGGDICRAAGDLRFPDVLRKMEVMETMYRRLEANIPDSVVVHAAFADLAIL